MLKLRVTDLDKIFDFHCTDFVIHGNDHFSRVFVVNAIMALETIKISSKKDHKNHVPSILLCNSMNQEGKHKSSNVTKFIIVILNYIISHKICTEQHMTSLLLHFQKNRFQIRKLKINL